MLRHFDVVPAPAFRLLSIVAAGAAVLAIAGCGIKGPLRLPPAPPSATSGTTPSPPAAPVPRTDAGATAPDAPPSR